MSLISISTWNYIHIAINILGIVTLITSILNYILTRTGKIYIILFITILLLNNSYFKKNVPIYLAKYQEIIAAKEQYLNSFPKTVCINGLLYEAYIVSHDPLSIKPGIQIFENNGEFFIPKTCKEKE